MVYVIYIYIYITNSNGNVNMYVYIYVCIYIYVYIYTYIAQKIIGSCIWYVLRVCTCNPGIYVRFRIGVFGTCHHLKQRGTPKELAWFWICFSSWSKIIQSAPNATLVCCFSHFCLEVAESWTCWGWKPIIDGVSRGPRILAQGIRIQ